MPATVEYLSVSLVTIAPAATIVPYATFVPPRIVAFDPIQTLLSISTGNAVSVDP